MTVPDCATDCGKISVAKTPKKNLTFCRVHNICVVSIINHSRPFVNYLFYGIIKFEIKYTVDGFGQRISEFQFYLDIAIIRM